LLSLQNNFRLFILIHPGFHFFLVLKIRRRQRYGSQADQGLLYYWTKYYKRQVSIVVIDKVEQWDADPENATRSKKLRTEIGTLAEHSCSPPPRFKNKNDDIVQAVPYRDFKHLTGRSKAWHKNLTKLQHDLEWRSMRGDPFEFYRADELWLWMLQDALRQTNLTHKVQLHEFIQGKREKPSVGISPTERQIEMYLQLKAQNGWRQYQYEFSDVEIMTLKRNMKSKRSTSMTSTTTTAAMNKSTTTAAIVSL
jgi:hypothetical protein